MKIIAVIFALCFAGIYAEISLTNEQLDNYIKVCLAKTKLSQTFYKSDDENLKFLSEEQKSCFMACMFKKSGIISNDGNVRSIRDDMDTATETIIENCKIKAAGDVCKLAWCLYKTEKFSIPIISDIPKY